MFEQKPKRVKRVFLVRHGQSQANVNPSKTKHVADHKIELTEEGIDQAQQAGLFLEDYIYNNLQEKIPFIERNVNRLMNGNIKRVVDSFVGAERDKEKYKFPKIRLWHSPYLRTRQTAAEIMDHCPYITDKKEHTLLVEQRFGIFDGLSDEEREEQYPEFQKNYQKAKDHGDKMFPKMPLGDSRFDVCQRVHQAFGTFHRDAQRHDIENIIVVGHGTTNRAFTLMWQHYNWEWMAKEPNPKNCSIRLLENGKDKGYIFKGF